MVSKVSQLSTTNQILRRRLRVESAQPTKEEEAQLRWEGRRLARAFSILAKAGGDRCLPARLFSDSPRAGSL